MATSGYLLATSGYLDLATRGYFFMATDTVKTFERRLASGYRRQGMHSRPRPDAPSLAWITDSPHSGTTQRAAIYRLELIVVRSGP
jgi:hypothetical protein